MSQIYWWVFVGRYLMEFKETEGIFLSSHWAAQEHGLFGGASQIALQHDLTVVVQFGIGFQLSTGIEDGESGCVIVLLIASFEPRRGEAVIGQV